MAGMFRRAFQRAHMRRAKEPRWHPFVTILFVCSISLLPVSSEKKHIKDQPIISTTCPPKNKLLQFKHVTERPKSIYMPPPLGFRCWLSRASPKNRTGRGAPHMYVCAAAHAAQRWSGSKKRGIRTTGADTGGRLWQACAGQAASKMIPAARSDPSNRADRKARQEKQAP